MRVLFAGFDKDADGKVSYEEFVAAIVGQLDARRKAYVEKAFELIDKDKNGRIDDEDISRAFDGWKHPDVKTGKKRQEDLLHEVLEILQLCTVLHVSRGRMAREQPSLKAAIRRKSSPLITTI